MLSFGGACLEAAVVLVGILGGQQYQTRLILAGIWMKSAPLVRRNIFC